MNKRGIGFRIPSYISPQDIMGELIGHEGVLMRYSNLTYTFALQTGYYQSTTTFEGDRINFLPLGFPCDFFEKGCKTNLTYQQFNLLYCNSTNSSCSFDGSSVGNCQPVSRLPECYQA